MILYHGSANIISEPTFGVGSVHNDYGQGFYCTESLELAKEWACFTIDGGYANKYEFDASGLCVLDLSDNSKYSILNWLAVLLENRTFGVDSDIAYTVKEYILDNFKPEYKSKDVIIGYRADDSYFSFADGFINNRISLAQLQKAMVLGNLGIQIVPMSKQAFKRLKHLESIPADGSFYYQKRFSRDQKAREEFRALRKDAPIKNEIYAIDILREEWKNNDPRLQRAIRRGQQEKSR